MKENLNVDSYSAEGINKENDWLGNLYNNTFYSSLIDDSSVKGRGKVDLCMIRTEKNSSFHPVGSIRTDNSIAVRYALKTTIDYLKNRSKIKQTKERRRLDQAAAINLKNISKYIGNDSDLKFEKNKNDNNSIINTNSKSNLDINNENIQQHDGPVATMLKLVNILRESINNVNGIDDSINNAGTNGQLQSIEPDVFCWLIKMDAIDKNNNESNNIINEQGNKPGLQVVNDFVELKNEIEEKEGKKKNNDVDNAHEEYDYKTAAEARNKKVFLSKAAKEFQDKVSQLDDVKKSKDRDKKVEDYNEAVEKLDNAIMEAVEERIKGNYNSLVEGYDKNQLGDIVTALDLKSTNENGINGNNIQKNNGVVNNNKSPKKFENFINGITGGYITGDDKKQLLSMLSKDVKKKLMSFTSDKNRQDYINAFLPEDKQKSVLEKLNEYTEKFKALGEKDKAKVLFSGDKIGEKENKNGDKNVNDLKAIANDKGLEKITLGYDEYNEFVTEGLFQNIDGIDKCMEDFLSNLLLADQDGDKFKKAKGQLDSIALQLNKELDSDNVNNGNNANKSLEQILSIGFGQCALGNKKNQKEEKFFVPTFIEHLFKLDSTGNLDDLAKNLKTLIEDENFQSLLSNIMKDEFAVEMIKKNFKETKKSFEDADYTVTRRGKFKQEFWDNNLKAMIPFVGHWSGTDEKRENVAMILGSLLTGLPIGIIIASVFGLSLFGGMLQAILTSLIIVATIIAIAALISFIITLVKGIKDWRNGRGFYKAGSEEDNTANKAKQALWYRIYNAFLTFGADEKKLKKLVQDNQRNQLDKKSSQGKFFQSMMDMKDFLEKNAKGDLNTTLIQSKPFKILEGKNGHPHGNPLIKEGNKDFENLIT